MLNKNQKFTLIDNPSLKGREDKYEIVNIDLLKILSGWRISLFSFEWLTPDGKIRPAEQLPDKEREKYDLICAGLKSGDPFPRPILGIGIMDNIEIGSRRDVLLTFITKGAKRMDVHVPKSLIEDFTPYL